MCSSRTLVCVAGFVMSIVFVGCGSDGPKTISTRAKEQKNFDTKEWPQNKEVTKYGGISIVVERILFNGDGSYTFFVPGQKYHSLEPMVSDDVQIDILADVEQGLPMRLDFYSHGNRAELHIHSGREIGGGGWTEVQGSGEDRKEIPRETGVIE